MARRGVRTKELYGSQVGNSALSQGQINEKIRKVAQELYEKRGRVPGHELDDWLEAEKIVKRTC